MKYIQGQNRNQVCLFPVTLEQAISEDNEVRMIDLFVDSIALEEFGFKVAHVENGRPAYHPADLLKLYIYGYMNKIRSARDFEKECMRNIELMWLIKCLKPDHNTISNFRRDNPEAINKVFRATVAIAKNFDLIGGRLVAGDSSKFRAQNSKKNNYNQKKIDRHLAYIEGKLEEYNSLLSENDGDNKELIKEEIEKQNKRKEGYKALEKELKNSGEPQLSTSDPESRQMIVRHNITEVAYNVQTTVDSKNNLLIDYKVTNNNDSKAMGNMLRRAKSILRTSDFTALYDKGYHTGRELGIASSLGVNTLVAVPGLPSSSEAPDPEYNVDKFIYNKEKDVYICPQGQELTTNGNWYNGKYGRFKQYKTRKCKQCKFKSLCTKSKGKGKVVQRSEYANEIEQNRKRVENNKALYKKRQAIVEHPYGTIKRQWGYSYILTKKTIKRASADIGIMMVAYNFRRMINILGQNALKAYFKEVISLFLIKMAQLKAKYSILRYYFLNKSLALNFYLYTKVAYI